MAAKVFHIANPDQLQDLNTYTKGETMSTLISVWTSARRRKGTTNLDDKIYARFSGDKSRTAEVVRYTNGNAVRCATLRYNLALKWCGENLEEAR